ncbi:MAG: type II toxin-antitoxin system prevent-host-death family antitoxin [Terricaulis sp.]
MADTWTVQDAKAQLSELLRRARAGEAQRIGVTDACVLVSEQEWAALHPSGLGAWLVESAPKGEELELPPRGSHRGDPFADDAGADDGKRR